MINTIKSILKSNLFLWKLSLLVIAPKRFFSLFPKYNIKGRGNKIKVERSARLYNCTFQICGDKNLIWIDKNVIAHNLKFNIIGHCHSIRILQNVQFNRSGMIWVEDNNCTIEIGRDSTFEEVHIAATEPHSKISIGEDCIFATGIEIRTGDSHSLLDNNSRKRINYAKDVIIGNRVWVASNASILKGSVIGSNSVVGTRAVVTGSFEESNILIGGIPAKKLKENIDWARERIP